MNDYLEALHKEKTYAITRGKDPKDIDAEIARVEKALKAAATEDKRTAKADKSAAEKRG